MPDPINSANAFIAFMSATMVLLFGASYALLFVMSRIKGRIGMKLAAYAAYAGLVFSTITLVMAGDLIDSGSSALLVLLLLLGYGFVPHLILRLRSGHHKHDVASNGVLQ